MPSTERILLTARAPLALQAAEWLLSSAPPGLPLDFRDTLIIVPTRNAGRLLREQLALLAARHNRALLAPKVLTPGALMAAQNQPHTASGLEWRLAWMRALAESPGRDLATLFPHLTSENPSLPDRQIPALAETFISLCDELAEAGHDPSSDSGPFAEAVRQLHENEAARWAQITLLASRARAILGEAGLETPAAPRLRLAQHGLPSPPAHVVLAGVLQFPCVIRRMLKALPASSRISVLLFTPGFSPGETAAFDEFGAPDESFWTSAALPVADEQIALADDPRAMTRAAVDDFARLLDAAAEAPSLALCDPSLAPLFTAEFDSRGAAVFDPAGLPLARSSPVQALDLLAALQAGPSMRNVAAAARHPAILDRLSAHAGLQPGPFLAALDELARERLPADLAAAAAAGGPLATALRALQSALSAASASPLGLIEWIWPSGQAKLPPGDIEILRTVAETIRGCRVPAGDRFRAALLPAALRSLASRRAAAAPPDGPFIELHGWLESAWLPGTGLILAGANDGLLPDYVDAHPFLPDSLKQRLGLQTNAMRHARDAALLRQLLGRYGADLRIHLSKTAATGEPLLPSRLLMQTAREHLPARMRRLFREPAPPPQTPPRSPAWSLRIPLPPPPAHLRVTAFRDFLSDPLLWLFRHQLRMEGPFDPAPLEADARLAGSLFHAVMEKFCKDPAAAALTAPAQIAAVLHTLLDAAVLGRFGKNPPLPVRIQAANLKRRLSEVARLEAASRAEGWRILAAEFPLPHGSLTAAGLPVTGTIDRIERHEPTGELRILDYKTRAKAETPEKTHFTTWRDTESWPPYCRAELPAAGGRTKLKRWADLQLPLYTIAIQNLHPHAPAVRACYLNAPAEPSATAIAEFPLTPALLQSALACAEGISSDILAQNLLFAWAHGNAWDFDSLLLRDLRPDSPPELIPAPPQPQTAP